MAVNRNWCQIRRFFSYLCDMLSGWIEVEFGSIEVARIEVVMTYHSHRHPDTQTPTHAGTDTQTQRHTETHSRRHRHTVSKRLLKLHRAKLSETLD